MCLIFIGKGRRKFFNGKNFAIYGTCMQRTNLDCPEMLKTQDSAGEGERETERSYNTEFNSYVK